MKIFSRSLGFRPSNPVLHDIYNRSIGLLALIALLPIFLIVAAALIVTQGREIYYRGPRLGKDGKIFHILKFRTLDSAAARHITRDRVLPPGTNIETPLGKILRANRLDELPQLVNIIRGEMVLCGPRPVRPEMAEIARREIPDYDRRFSVKPGLVGPAQAYASHGTCKIIRSRIDNAMLDRPVSYVAEWRLLATIGASVLGMVARDLGHAALRLRPGRARSLAGRARVEKEIWLEFPEGQERALSVSTIGPKTLTVGQDLMLVTDRQAVLCMRLRRGGIRRASVVLSGSDQARVFNFATLTPVGQFMLERYGLSLAIVSPRLRPRPAAAGEQMAHAPVAGWSGRPVASSPLRAGSQVTGEAAS